MLSMLLTSNDGINDLELDNDFMFEFITFPGETASLQANREFIKEITERLT